MIRVRFPARRAARATTAVAGSSACVARAAHAADAGQASGTATFAVRGTPNPAASHTPASPPAPRSRRAPRALPAALALAAFALAGCAVGPDYHRPGVDDTPAAWQPPPGDAYWQRGTPSHAPLAPDWWEAFNDPLLDALETRALGANQTLAVAAAHYAQAQAALASTSASLLPSIGLGASAARERISADRPLTNYAQRNMSTVQNDTQIGANASYELDLFGRIRRTVEAARASTEQSGDDLVNARLVLTADLATAYLALRETDAETDVLNRSVALQQKALDFVTAQHELGAVSGLNLLQQRSQLDATKTQAQLLLNTRQQYEHAIATLVGTPAPSFSIAPRVQPLTAPRLPTGVPSELLQRRPDVASAERAMAAANAQIGIAHAAYFPRLTLSPDIGWEATRFASLFTVPALVWSVGASVSQPLFEGGRLKAGVEVAQAGYDAARASYRQTVLTAFQEVQNAVTGLSALDEAERRARAAVDDARQLVSLAQDRYGGGLTAYIDVISAQQQLLTSERQEVQIRGQRAALVVYLAKALGGGWSGAAPVAANVTNGDTRGGAPAPRLAADSAARPAAGIATGTSE
ncbi:RND efflux transporter, outer membrane factor (OMF) lipoprotein, NodT family [Burkholderia plantarii]|uniref:RND efflux transporter, outer membrane factor (OMF) lipoprotein, NodT family n=1 Tax=Burkholderia plantarii TaxID=41899 RepID=A0A0B6RVR3_BURPL|nr:RND efflux transporter, outer membrane factor (OMF) lipoprotein, NodT family [Burkholderia plantarii]